MTDTLKLIIEIPKPMYENVQNGTYCGTLYEELKNGIPLDDVKSEIDKAQEPYKTSTAYDEGVRFGLMLAYQIIHKYKAESEGE